MSHQIFLLSLHAASQEDDSVREELADAIHRCGGFILMATGTGALITAFDEQWAGRFRRHPAVEHCGALNLDPHKRAADKLRQLFAANVAAQLASRDPVAAPTPDTRTAPRHRPLTWHRPATPHPADATGVCISLQHHARGSP